MSPYIYFSLSLSLSLYIYIYIDICIEREREKKQMRQYLPKPDMTSNMTLVHAMLRPKYGSSNKDAALQFCRIQNLDPKSNFS
jgi:hypothetical protein